ncbi:EcsC family protein [Myxococcota bacterium]|nr:EcsC family protein [Myxococcota bacterium]
MSLSQYEKSALMAIHAWKNPEQTYWSVAKDVIGAPFDVVGDAVMQIPGVAVALERSVGGLLSLLTDASALTVRTGAIFAEFDPPIAGLAEIHPLDLEHADRPIGYLAAKYKALAMAEGAASGSASLLGPVVGGAAILADVTALVSLNLRAVGEYATYYGFDITRQEERLYMLNVLGLASAPSDAAKAVVMAQLVRIAREVAQRKVWQQLEQHLFVQIVKQIAKALAIRLTKAKLAQVIPAAGAAIGGGFNAYYTAKVCDAAYFLYRERFLARKYGPEIIEASAHAGPDVDLGAGYDEG